MRRVLNIGGREGPLVNNIFFDDSSEDEDVNDRLRNHVVGRGNDPAVRPVLAHYRRMLPALPVVDPRPHPPGNPDGLGQLEISWMNHLSNVGFPDSVAISELPGLNFRDRHRILSWDIATIKSSDITDVVCLLTPREFIKFRVPNLLQNYEDEGLVVYHFPIDDGMIPDDVYGLNQLLVKIRKRIADGNRVLVHCFGGMGRAVLVGACLTLTMDEDCTPTEVIELMRELRGPRAVQSVKQYNFINEFRHLSVSAAPSNSDEERCVSR